MTKTPVDIYLGTGGGPDVLAAAALHCLGGQMQTRLVFNNSDEVQQKNWNYKFKQKYSIDDMIKNDVIFCATVTDGDMLKGIKINDDTFEANFILHKSQNISKTIST